MFSRMGELEVIIDEDDLEFRLPLNRVRKICKLDPEVATISLEAVKAITLATV